MQYEMCKCCGALRGTNHKMSCFVSEVDDSYTLGTLISNDELDRLLGDAEWLECLQMAGVNNWPGSEYAISLLKSWHGKDEDA